MIVVDSSIWVDFFRTPHERLAGLIGQDALIQHPFVTGEVGMGSFASRAARAGTIEMLLGLEPMVVVLESQFHDFVADADLFGTGAGFVDCHLLASLSESPEASLWTRDKRLATQAERLGLRLFA